MLVAIRDHHRAQPIRGAKYVPLKLGAVELSAHTPRALPDQVQGHLGFALLEVALEAALREGVDDQPQQFAGLRAGRSRGSANNHEEDVVYKSNVVQRCGDPRW